jgi:hypothetical protein
LVPAPPQKTKPALWKPRCFQVESRRAGGKRFVVSLYVITNSRENLSSAILPWVLVLRFQLLQFLLLLGSQDALDLRHRRLMSLAHFFHLLLFGEGRIVPCRFSLLPGSVNDRLDARLLICAEIQRLNEMLEPCSRSRAVMRVAVIAISFSAIFRAAIIFGANGLDAEDRSGAEKCD